MVKKNKDKEEKFIKPISLSFGDALDKIINHDKKSSKSRVEVIAKKKEDKEKGTSKKD